MTSFRPCTSLRPFVTIAVPLLIVIAMVIAAPGLSVRPAAAHGTAAPPELFGRGPQSVYAYREPNIFTHNVGLLTLQVTNVGILGNPFSDELTSAGWRGGEYLYGAGLWIGAIGEDAEPHVSTAMDGTARGWELRPSILPVDKVYASFEGVKDGARPGFFKGDDDDDNNEMFPSYPSFGWMGNDSQIHITQGTTLSSTGRVDEDFQNGIDDDGDGRIDEDFAAIGQQMFSCQYRDNTAEAMNQSTEHKPLGLLIQQRSFQWSAQGINEFVGLDFRVINIGDQRLTNIYLGFMVDADAGPKSTPFYWTDDLVGYTRVDTVVVNPAKPGGCGREKLSMDIAYIWDVPDDGSQIVGGDVPGYFGAMFLGHTTDPTGIKAPKRVGLSTVKWTVGAGVYPVGDPRTDSDRYDLLSRGTIPTRNAFKPDDYRFYLGAGPFAELDPGDNLTFQTAFVIGEGKAGMIDNAIGAQRVFNGQYVDGDKNKLTGVDGKETCLHTLDAAVPILWDNPCDTLVMVNERTKNMVCDETGKWVDDDCNECTGVGGKEMLLNWVGTTAPPPPAVNTDPGLQDRRMANPNVRSWFNDPSGDRRVVLQWDDVSEHRPDPMTGRDLFEGYRIWRVDGWQRPEGSIGPTPEQWMLVAEFRKNPRDGLGYDSPTNLNKVLHRERADIREIGPDGKPSYYVGRYEWADSNGVLNGKIYFYGITAFGLDTLKNMTTGQPELIEIGGSPAAIQRELVVSSWAYGNGCADVKVVPNPYRGGADWDIQPSDCDPTGTRIAFRNLPEGWKQLSIYTLTGDLVLTAGPDGSRVVGACEVATGNRRNGTFYWDLVSRSGQNIVSGVYLYVVETGRDLCRGRFVVIR